MIKTPPYNTLFVDGEDFEDIGIAFEEKGLAKIGKIGNADSKLMQQRNLVDFSVPWIEKHRK